MLEIEALFITVIVDTDIVFERHENELGVQDDEACWPYSLC